MSTRPYWHEGPPTKTCGSCRAAFYTGVGLAEHRRLGCGTGPVLTAVRRRWTTGQVSPAGLAAMQARGRQIAAENNARRRRCDECGKVSTCSGLGLHQKYTGHTGWTEAA